MLLLPICLTVMFALQNAILINATAMRCQYCLVLPLLLLHLSHYPSHQAAELRTSELLAAGTIFQGTLQEQLSVGTSCATL